MLKVYRVTNDFICWIRIILFILFITIIKFRWNYSYTSNQSTCQYYLLSETLLQKKRKNEGYKKQAFPCSIIIAFTRVDVNVERYPRDIVNKRDIYGAEIRAKSISTIIVPRQQPTFVETLVPINHALSIFPAFAARDVDSLNCSRRQLALSRHGGRQRIDGVGRPSLRTVTCQPIARKAGGGFGDGHPWPCDGHHARRGIVLRPRDHRVPWNARQRTPNNTFPGAK